MRPNRRSHAASALEKKFIEKLKYLIRYVHPVLVAVSVTIVIDFFDFIFIYFNTLLQVASITLKKFVIVINF